MKLAIIGETRHSRDEYGRLHTLSPVLRQIRPWLERFDQVIVCAPLLPGPPPAHHEPYRMDHVRLRPLPHGGGEDLRSKIGLVQRVAQWWPVLRRTLRECDAVHFRCPCNIALVGLLAMRGLPLRRFAMYAGNWAGYPGESPFYRLQRRWLNSPRFGGTAAVYGSWPGQPPHVLSSFSPSFTLEEWIEEERPVERKLLRYLESERLQPLCAVSVGHLNADKSQETILRALSRLRAQGLPVHVEFLGDGPERGRLEALACELDLRGQVVLRGRVSLEAVREAYRTAHLGLLASRSEGFPKVLAEAMVGGAVPVASNVGINHEIVGDGERGLLFPYGDDAVLAARLRQLAENPQALYRMAARGRAYARSITLDVFHQLQEHILSQHMGVPAQARVRPLPEEVLV